MSKIVQQQQQQAQEKALLEEEVPIPLRTVYETLDGEPWTATDRMPDYETVFQGF
jgi:hypothetical protein